MIKVKVRTGLDKILPGRILNVSDELSSFYVTITDKLSGHNNAMPSYMYNILYKFGEEVFPMTSNVGPNCIWRYIKGDNKFIIPKEEAEIIINGYRKHFETLSDKPETIYVDGLSLKNLHYAEKTIKFEDEYDIKHYEILVYPFLDDINEINIWDELRKEDIELELIEK